MTKLCPHSHVHSQEQHSLESANASVALCRFLSHSGSSGSKPRPPPQPRRYVPFTTLTSHMDVKYSAEQIGFNLLDCLFWFQCFSRWRQQRSIDALWSGQLVRLKNNMWPMWSGIWKRLGTPLMETVCLQPSSSCSFDGSLKLDQSDSESKWPEIPPVLNQNEDRKKNKYLRKDYLKVQGPTVGNSECLFFLNACCNSCEILRKDKWWINEWMMFFWKDKNWKKIMWEISGAFVVGQYCREIKGRPARQLEGHSTIEPGDRSETGKW